MLLENSQRHLTLADSFLKWSGRLMIPLYVSIVVALWGAFLFAPTEKEMGELQRIFYFHVSPAMVSYLAFLGVFLGGILYLIRRQEFWDSFAASCAEVGLLLTIIVLTTGPIWSKPAWGTWLAWNDPRVMTELVLLLLFISYFILRSVMPPGDRMYKYAAVFGILASLDVPIVHMSIRWWRTIHPHVFTATEIKLDPDMKIAWILAILAFVILVCVFVFLRTAMRLQEGVTHEFYHALAERRT